MSIQTIERTTLTNLIWDEDYARKVIPFIKPEYYSDRGERVIFEEITKFTEKYNAIPTQEALTIEIDSRKVDIFATVDFDSKSFLCRNRIVLFSELRNLFKDYTFTSI